MTRFAQVDSSIAVRILTLRGMRVILDADLARLCGVQTRRLNEQVGRNAGRFPPVSAGVRFSADKSGA